MSIGIIKRSSSAFEVYRPAYSLIVDIEALSPPSLTITGRPNLVLLPSTDDVQVQLLCYRYYIALNSKPVLSLKPSNLQITPHLEARASG